MRARNTSSNKHEPAESFATTLWSEVLLAGKPDASGAHIALCRLCEKYWYPVYAFLRRSGHNSNDAEDLTQAFFADLIESGKLSVANSARGKFRSFLLVACRNFVSNVHRFESAKRRGGDHKRVAFDVDVTDAAQRYDQQSQRNWTPEQIYDRHWALELLELAIQRVREDYVARNQAEWFEALQPFIAPVGDPPAHAAIAELLNTSVGSVKTAVHRLRKRFGQALQEEVSETLVAGGDVKDELNTLLDALAGR